MPDEHIKDEHIKTRKPMEAGGGSFFVSVTASERGGALSVLIAALAVFILLAVLFHRFYPRGKKEAGEGRGAELVKVEEDDSFFRPDLSGDLRADVGGGGKARGWEEKVSSAIKEGDYGKASVFLRAAIKGSPDSVELKTALSRTLNKIALNDYGAGNYLSAKNLLDEAIMLSPEDGLYENRAHVLIKLNDPDGALASLESIPEGARGDGTRRLLKSVFIQLGNRSQLKGDTVAAREHFEKALQNDPADDGLRAALNRMGGGSAEAGMERSSGAHFIVRFDGGENAVAGHLIGLLLEEAYYRVGGEIGYYPDHKIEAVLYSREDFRGAAHSAWAGAVYDGRIKLSAGGVTEKTAELEKVIFHEYTHAVVHMISGGRAPAWLNEGLAQYMEGDRASRYGNFIKKAVGQDGGITLRSLEGSFIGLREDDAARAYLLSLSAAEYLIREFGLPSVRRILEGIGRGEGLDAAIQSSIYISYDRLEKSWLETLR